MRSKEQLTDAMEAAGFHLDDIESTEDYVRFYGEDGTLMSMEGWDKVEEWLEGVVFDDPEISDRVEEIMESDAYEPEEEIPKEIDVLVVEPMAVPYMKTIPNTLEAKQKEVGGYIEITYPFEDNVGIICNEEGKLDGLPLNRAIYDQDGEIYDVLSGKFLIAGLTETDFRSLTPDEIEKYTTMYSEPQIFMRDNGEIKAISIAEKGKNETDKLAKAYLNIFKKLNLEEYRSMDKNTWKEQGVTISALLRSGIDHRIRDSLQNLVKADIAYSPDAFRLLRKIDEFYKVNEIPRYEIYQLRHDVEGNHQKMFTAYEVLKNHGVKVDAKNYECVYSGRLTEGENLDSVYEKFNLRHPEDFRGHSLSVSDVVVFRKDGVDQAFYVDPIGYANVPEFISTLEQSRLITPEKMETHELVRTPRGLFYVTDMSRKEMEDAGYGLHHMSADQKFLIMGDGTTAYAIRNDEAFRNAEMSIEDDYDMIDGILGNNGNKEKEYENTTETSLKEKIKSYQEKVDQRSTDSSNGERDKDYNKDKGEER